MAAVEELGVHLENMGIRSGAWFRAQRELRNLSLHELAEKLHDTKQGGQAHWDAPAFTRSLVTLETCEDIEQLVRCAPLTVRAVLTFYASHGVAPECVVDASGGIVRVSTPSVNFLVDTDGVVTVYKRSSYTTKLAVLEEVVRLGRDLVATRVESEKGHHIEFSTEDYKAAQAEADRTLSVVSTLEEQRSRLDARIQSAKHDSAVARTRADAMGALLTHINRKPYV